jgi:phenylalanyl-tRNA synthetase beta chain
VDFQPEGPQPLSFRIPTFRVDLKREIDLIEEIARLFGVEKIPATAPRGAIGSNEYDQIHDALAEARRILTGLGLFEAQGQTLISSSAAKMRRVEGLVPLANPLSSDMNVLRPSLLPGLLDALRHNISHNNLAPALFEIGRVFFSSVVQTETQKSAGPVSGPREERRLGIAISGQRDPLFWSGQERDAKFDIFDLKGFIEEFFEQFGLRGATYNRRQQATDLFLESATIQLGKFQLGELGQLLPVLTKRYDLRDAVFLAELNLDIILARRNSVKSFRDLPTVPAIRRDVAMLVAETITHEAVLQVVKQAQPANLETVELFDIFRGKDVPPGQKSMAYALTYRNPERTLTDAEANSAHAKLIEQLKADLKAVVRE